MTDQMEPFQGQPGPTQPTRPTDTAPRLESQDVTAFQLPGDFFPLYYQTC
jgi:hypothetical protein